eukprot:scaffold73_cov337-Pavlova_lutheri.AAC.54
MGRAAAIFEINLGLTGGVGGRIGRDGGGRCARVSPSHVVSDEVHQQGSAWTAGTDHAGAAGEAEACPGACGGKTPGGTRRLVLTGRETSNGAGAAQQHDHRRSTGEAGQAQSALGAHAQDRRGRASNRVQRRVAGRRALSRHRRFRGHTRHPGHMHERPARSALQDFQVPNRHVKNHGTPETHGTGHRE